MITSFGGPEMDVLLAKLDVQGWSSLLFQGNEQRKLEKKEVNDFYINGKSDGTLFSSQYRILPSNLHLQMLLVSCTFQLVVGTTMLSMTSHLWTIWLQLLQLQVNSMVTLIWFSIIWWKRRCLRYISFILMWFIKFYFQRRTEVNILDLTLMELLNTGVRIDFPSLIIKHMHRVLNQDKNWHVLPYGIWLASIF